MVAQSIHQLGFGQALHHSHDPAGPVHVLHVVVTGRRQFHQVRRLASATLLKVSRSSLTLASLAMAMRVKHRCWWNNPEPRHRQGVLDARVGEEPPDSPALRVTSTAATPLWRARVSRAEYGAGWWHRRAATSPETPHTQPWSWR